MLSLNDDYWVDLAHKLKVRLPKSATPLTTGPMERWLKRVGVSVTQYKEWTGGQGLKAFIAANPEWTLRQWVGVLLEWAAESADVSEA